MSGKSPSSVRHFERRQRAGIAPAERASPAPATPGFAIMFGYPGEGAASNGKRPKRMTAVELGAEYGQENQESRRQRRMEAFNPSYRRQIRSLTAGEPTLEDLADTFPALLFALCTGYGTAPKRQRSIELVRSGAGLREAAAALGLAWWLRRLPAQAFSEPVPTFPDTPDYALRIASLIPREAHRAPGWLRRVGQAQEAAGSDYALWMARQPEPDWSEEALTFMAAWAWFAGQPGLLGHRLLRRPWSADMSFRRAREEMTAWRQRVRLIEYLGSGIETPWLADASVGGFSFVALRTVDDFIAESDALDNCLDQYADRLNSGQTAVFSIRKGMRHVACVEIGLHDQEASMPAIVQLRGVRNRRAPPEVWQAAYAWLGGQRLEPLSPERHAPKAMQRLSARRRLWQPYIAFLEASGRAQAFRRAVMERPRLPRARRGRPRGLGAAPPLLRARLELDRKDG
jgi:hypothetical protein